MPTGFRNNAGVDLEDLFEAGTVQAAGFRLSNGSNIAFAARGSATKAADVGFRDNAGSDLSNLWLPKGAAPPVLGFNGQTYSADSQAPPGGIAPATAFLSLTLASSGAWSIVRTVSGSINGNGTTTLASGTWLPSGGTVSDYEVQFGISNVGGGDVTNGAPTFAALTTTRTASLSLTVPAASSQDEVDSASVTCALRRIGQAASGSSCTFNCHAMGYQA